MDFKLKEPITWREKKALQQSLDRCDYSLERIFKTRQLPVEFVEAAFLLCLEGFDSEEAIYALPISQQQAGAALVFERVIIAPELEKKS